MLRLEILTQLPPFEHFAILYFTFLTCWIVEDQLCQLGVSVESPVINIDSGF